MNKLIVITASALLWALVNPAMAAKPVTVTVTEVKLTAGPMVQIQTCRVANHTDQAIAVFMELCFAPKDNSAQAQCFDVSPTGTGDPAPVVGLLAPGHYEPTTILKTDGVTTTHTCELTYTGAPGDITGMACGSITATNTNTACVPLQAP